MVYYYYVHNVTAISGDQELVDGPGRIGFINII